jgi:hypothetical protein
MILGEVVRRTDSLKEIPLNSDLGGEAATFMPGGTVNSIPFGKTTVTLSADFCPHKLIGSTPAKIRIDMILRSVGN